MKNNEHVLEDSIFNIGKVVSVDGRVVSIEVNKLKNTSHVLYKGDLLKNISVGGYVKIIKGFTKIIGKVKGEYISEDKKFSKKVYGNAKQKVHRILDVNLLGFFNGKQFERGIKELPLIDNECFLLKKEEFDQVHNFLRNSDDPIVIGRLAFEKGQAISLGVNSLFASHIGIFGNTGSGKSYTLAKMYRELFLKYKDNANFKKNAKFFFVDFNGEYAAADDVIIEKKYKNVYRLSTGREDGDKFPIQQELLYEPTFLALLTEATEKTQTPFLQRVVSNRYIADKLNSEEDFKTLLSDMIYSATSKDDRNLEKGVVVNLLEDLRSCLSGSQMNDLILDYKSKLQFHSAQGKYYYQPAGGGTKIFSDHETFKTSIVCDKVSATTFNVTALDVIDKIELRIILLYYDEIIKGYSNKDYLAPLIKRVKKKVNDLKKVVKISNEPNGGKNITILSLKDVNIHMRKILPMLLCKKLYDDKKEKNNDETYLNIIIDEAHNILSKNSERESEQWKDYRLETFEEIVKEGRKFGVFLTIASQRPSDISDTIISQLHNYFLHRLINNNDIMAVEKTISFLDKVSFDSLAILPTGTCILAGLIAQVPVVIDVSHMDKKYEPNNKTRPLTKYWQ
ncbi:MAG: ATP-binding protein [Candidatus Peribacteraceae bacterium]|nr:ATP-binding protein [Candidatus Peribacteraceae bacterium]